MDINKLKRNIPQTVLDQLPDTIAKFNINTPLRLSHFLSQCAHESANFTVVKENLNYSAKGLLTTFKKYFTPELAKQYERNPEKIANRVYGGRMGNGNEASGEGYKFSGRGYIQLTGKVNYAAFDKLVPEDILATPTLVASKYPLLSAAWFFNNNNLWVICDSPIVDKDGNDCHIQVITHLTQHINGGTNGILDRIEYFHKFYNLLKEN